MFSQLESVLPQSKRRLFLSRTMNQSCESRSSISLGLNINLLKKSHTCWLPGICLGWISMNLSLVSHTENDMSQLGLEILAPTALLTDNCPFPKEVSYVSSFWISWSIFTPKSRKSEWEWTLPFTLHIIGPQRSVSWPQQDGSFRLDTSEGKGLSVTVKLLASIIKKSTGASIMRHGSSRRANRCYEKNLFPSLPRFTFLLYLASF